MFGGGGTRQTDRWILVWGVNLEAPEKEVVFGSASLYYG